jgi:DNA anti-recombination protein RmuC
MHNESDSISKMSDTATTISTLKSSVSDLNSLFNHSFNELNEQSKRQAAIQKQQGEALHRLLEYLTATNSGFQSTTQQSEVANNPQTQSAGDSQGVTGHC